MYKVPTLKCRKCGHVWVPRTEEVRQCPNCRTAYWDMERDENGKIIKKVKEKQPENFKKDEK